jgi:uridine kinase
MEVGPVEPVAGPWRVERLDVCARLLADAAGDPSSRPRIVAVDGRGGGGKTMLVDRLCRVMAGTVVVHTDDVAWAHSRFGWDGLMIEGILEPLHAGRDVHYQPPAWQPHGRTGQINVPADASTVIVEGVGASRREMAHLVDVVVWVQSDFDEARRRGVGRNVVDQGVDRSVALQKWSEWQAEEVPFLLDDRPWERANFIVANAPMLAHDSQTEVVIALPLHAEDSPSGRARHRR